MISHKQSIIIDYLRNNESIDLDKAVELIGFGIYHNARKYVGLTLSRMVKQKHIVRIKKGVFELPNLGNVKLSGDDLFNGNEPEQP